MKTGLGWVGIVRLGLVQASLGSIVVLTTSTLNRIMVVELGLAALLPGVLVAIHYAIQVLRPRFGHGSDCGGRRTPWIIGGMAVLGLGGIVAAASTLVLPQSLFAGILVATLGFLLIGAGVGASGTSLLVLLAAEVAPERRAAAASITWILMIIGFIVTTVTVGHFLDPFTFIRLVGITALVSLCAFVVSFLAVFGIESERATFGADDDKEAPSSTPFSAAIREVMAERQTRRFALFVFMSMLAYSAQDLLLEPFAGAIFGMSPGESTQLGGVQHGGVLLGMIIVALIGSGIARHNSDILRRCMLGGCLGSAVILIALAASAFKAPIWPIQATVFGLGLTNGLFAVAAIGCMMSLVSEGHKQRDGVRMGVWGAAQAVAFGLGGILGTLMVDVVRFFTADAAIAYASAFALQAVLFLLASRLAAQLSKPAVVRVLESEQVPSGALGVN